MNNGEPKELPAVHKITDREACIIESDLLLSDMDRLRNQIDMAKRKHAEADTWADPEWLTRAEAALRHKARRYNALIRRAGELRNLERQKTATQFSQRFVAAAKRRLKPETYAAIVDEARMESVVELE